LAPEKESVIHALLTRRSLASTILVSQYFYENKNPAPAFVAFNIFQNLIKRESWLRLQGKRNRMKITYYGHACFAAEISGKHLLFDPFIRQNPLAKGIDIKKVKADYILVSHGHDDHLADACDIAEQTGAPVIANFEVADWLSKQGVKKVHHLNPGGSCPFPFGRAKFVHAIHSSSLPDGSYGGSAGSFVVESPEGNFYFSGDTALTLDMKLVSEVTKLKFVVLCIGGGFTMDVDDAIRAANLLECKEVIGVHYDTFPPIKIDHAAAKEKFRAKGMTLHLLPIGGTREF
jgi:L-ascorbate metabolism protein UlaG (beta-lactamase superfamily)